MLKILVSHFKDASKQAKNAISVYVLNVAKKLDTLKERVFSAAKCAVEN
jgi:hypothetical protein